jgi:hypothetical protein
MNASKEKELDMLIVQLAATYYSIDLNHVELLHAEYEVLFGHQL